MQGQRNMLVPSQNQLEAHFAARWPSSKRLIGLKNPVILTSLGMLLACCSPAFGLLLACFCHSRYPLSYYAISQTRAKLLVVLCDPLRRLEKLCLRPF